jgi:hypothetical protein
MIPPKKKNPFRKKNFQNVQKNNHFYRIRTPVDVVSEEEIGGRGRISFSSENAEKIVEVAVNVTDDDEITGEIEEGRFDLENGSGAVDDRRNGRGWRKARNFVGLVETSGEEK